ncbi:hypothetical protein [Candidatus Pantoea persica]|nr:hypothetical protein [Candidatus Pantoea persica]
MMLHWRERINKAFLAEFYLLRVGHWKVKKENRILNNEGWREKEERKG